MPRVTKDAKKENLEIEKEAKTAVKKKETTRKTSAKKITASKDKKVTTTKATAKKSTTSTASKKTASKTSATTTEKKKTDTALKKTTSKVSAKAMEISKEKKAKTSATTTTKGKATSTSKKSKLPLQKAAALNPRKLESNIIAEYYDLPYRYNETVVKILYQTPTILFVYWDISDYDRAFLQKEYGDRFFANTKPILKVFNLTKNYQFEIEINDFANSWYIHVPDSNCEYKVELDRKTIPNAENTNEAYVYISSSNDIEIPNDHILIDELPDKLRFKNIKTNAVSIKDITTLRFIGISKIYNIYDFYKRFYNDDIWEEINNRKMLNPSSMFSS